MRLVLILVIFTLYSCSTSKSVLICGDHECINKEEAKLFFKEKLTLEVKIITKNNEITYSVEKGEIENINILLFNKDNRKFTLNYEKNKMTKKTLKKKDTL